MHFIGRYPALKNVLQLHITRYFFALFTTKRISLSQINKDISIFRLIVNNDNGIENKLLNKITISIFNVKFDSYNHLVCMCESVIKLSSIHPFVHPFVHPSIHQSPHSSNLNFGVFNETPGATYNILNLNQ